MEFSDMWSEDKPGNSLGIFTTALPLINVRNNRDNFHQGHSQCLVYSHHCFGFRVTSASGCNVRMDVSMGNVHMNSMNCWADLYWIVLILMVLSNS